MVPRPLGRTGLNVTPIGFGAFKIGRNQGTKYPKGYALPDADRSERLINAVLDMGINYIDTAPAYGVSEERIGAAIGGRRGEVVLSTKVGETFNDGRSAFDYSGNGIRRSVEQSLRRLNTDVLDIVFIHSDGRDIQIINDTGAVPVLEGLKEKGLIRAIGMSPKTPGGATVSLLWADVVMVEHNLDCRDNEAAIATAHAGGVGVIVKKGLGSGRLDPDESVRFVLSNPGVDALTIGTLDPEHLRQNIASATRALVSDED